MPIVSISINGNTDQWMTANKDRGPRVFFPPPLIFILASIIGYMLETIYPLATLESYFWTLAGSTGMVLCIGVLCYSLWTYIQSKTHIEPWQPSSHLITTGLYAYSRNPIYLTFGVFTLSLGMVISSLWIMLLTAPAMWLIQTYVIAREEAYLEKTFRDKYIKYKRQVGRWL